MADKKAVFVAGFYESENKPCGRAFGLEFCEVFVTTARA